MQAVRRVALNSQRYYDLLLEDGDNLRFDGGFEDYLAAADVNRYLPPRTDYHEYGRGANHAPEAICSLTRQVGGRIEREWEARCN